MKLVVVALALLHIVAAYDLTHFEENDVSKIMHVTFNHIYVDKPLELRDCKYANETIASDDTEVFISKIRLDFMDTDIVKSMKLMIYGQNQFAETIYKAHLESNGPVVDIDIEKIYMDPHYKLVFTFYIDVANLFKGMSYNISYHEQIVHQIHFTDVHKYGCVIGGLLTLVKSIKWPIYALVGWVALVWFVIIPYLFKKDNDKSN